VKKLVEIGMNNAPAGEKREKRKGMAGRRRNGERNVEMCHDTGDGERKVEKRGKCRDQCARRRLFSRANFGPSCLMPVLRPPSLMTCIY